MGGDRVTGSLLQPQSDDGDPFGVLPVGTLIAKYEIVDVLGQGGFGITYRARDTQLDREVAIKEYLPTSCAKRLGGLTVLPRTAKAADDFHWGRERFLDEARTLARLEAAPGIVGVHDFLEANGTAYMVMALVRGETLEARLRRTERLTQTVIEHFLTPLLDGLERVHEAGFVHRDITPSNILIDSNGLPTLIDFGASRLALQGRTQAMTAIVTPGYAAPEQATAGRQGPWTDIYGMAATLYRCVAGTPPPPALQRMADDRLAPAAVLGRGHYTASLLTVIDAGLRLKAGERPQTIGAWRRMMAVMPPAATVMPRDTITRRMHEPLVPLQAPTKLRPRLAAAMACGVMAVGATIAWMSFRPAVEAPRQGQSAVLPPQEDAARKPVEDKAKADSEARRQAEAAEAALRLSEQDRRRVQIALTSLGHDTRGSDGYFGARTRQMIALWQKNQNVMDTGFLTAVQLPMLYRQAAPALSRYDEDLRRQDEARRAEETRRADEERRRQPQSATAAPPADGVSAYDGRWTGTLRCDDLLSRNQTIELTIGNGRGTYRRNPLELALELRGDRVRVSLLGASDRRPGASVQGELNGRSTETSVEAAGAVRSPGWSDGSANCTLSLSKQ
ncbi:protein kinase [Reyranella sp. CPCC 100927]|nr:protein kinase [Reyranella sp. CPCC 100927]